MSYNDNGSPIRRIPREILGLIFMEGFNDDHTRIPTISQVCSLWREVALSFSVFWANIDLDLSEGKSRSKGFLELLDLQLQRSRNALLKVKLVMDKESALLHPAPDKILGTSNRWVTATLTVSGVCISLLDQLNGQLTNLRTLFLRSTVKFRFGMTDLTYYRMFESAPSLSEVRIDFPRTPPAPYVSLPWPQLVIYEETVDNPAKDIALMTFCRTLKMMWRRYPLGFDSRANLPTGPIVLENLSVFHFNNDYTDESTIFSCLRLPNIRELWITTRYWETLSPYLVSMFRDPPTLLQNLQIHQPPASPSSLVIDVLRLTPYLTKPRLWIPYNFDALASYLSRPDSLPQLQTLILFSTGESISKPENILKIVHGRCERPIESESGPVFLSLRLQYYEDFHKINLELEALNRKHRPPGFVEPPVPPKLSEWARFLENFDIEQPVQQTRDFKWLLYSLMRFDIQHVEHLHSTHIHLYLDRFVNQGPDDSSKWDFRRPYVREILRQWNDMLLADLPNRRWAKMGYNKLVHIPSDDSLRSTNPLQIIYGFPDVDGSD